MFSFSSLVKLTINQSTVPIGLIVDKTKTKILCSDSEKVTGSHHALCENVFSTGKYYWQVDLGYSGVWTLLKNRQSWYVGVCTDTAEQKQKISLSPRNGFWVLQYNKGTGLYLKTEPQTPVPVNELFKTIGVFLDCDEHTLTFYNADKDEFLCRMNVTPNIENKLIPLVSPGVRDTEPMTLQPARHKLKLEGTRFK